MAIYYGQARTTEGVLVWDAKPPGYQPVPASAVSQVRTRGHANPSQYTAAASNQQQPRPEDAVTHLSPGATSYDLCAEALLKDIRGSGAETHVPCATTLVKSTRLKHVSDYISSLEGALRNTLEVGKSLNPMMEQTRDKLDQAKSYRQQVEVAVVQPSPAG